MTPSSWWKASIATWKKACDPATRRSRAARDLANPIIAMTIVLIAVYVPIGFQGGLTGALFTEFAFTVVGAVTMSAVVALTLSPMMCGYLLKPHAQGPGTWLVRPSDRPHRPRLHPLAARLRTPPARQPAHPAGNAAVRRDRHRQHLLPVRQRQQRTGAAGGPGRHHPVPHLRPRCDSATKAAVRRPGAGHHGEGAGGGSKLPGRKPDPVDRRHHPETLGRPPPRRDGDPAAVARPAQRRRRPAHRRLPAARACPARRACRSSSC